MKKVSQLLSQKGKDVASIEAHESVYDALERMVARNIGALVVCQEGECRGLLTERDYARKVILKGKSSKDTLVSEIMDPQFASVTMNDSIEHCMALMSDKHIRYLPVLAEKQVVGLVSMGDLVRFIIEDQTLTIQDLKNYISGTV
ncbi:MAG: CBS domain-containing protein [Cytophagaceae bacterium]|nr:CBS domain-containing protein [Cytophagaceae bacterium]